MKILLIIVLILLIGGFIILSNNHLRLNSSQNVRLFYNLYIKWLSDSIYSSKEITGKVIDFFNK